ncbi:hypothetical protein [Marmoricola sp. RAF53]|uniref:hypothetical protein n=1 Tax=Marmoricola sp. RAF53 TaxID=3233059 RepID=UPI003F9E35EF
MTTAQLPVVPVAPVRPATITPGLRILAAACAAVAGGIHLWVVPEHYQEAWVLGTFFVLVGAGQLVLAAVLRWVTATWFLVTALLANLGLIALYVVSRTAELPFVPPHTHGGEHLPVFGGVGNGTPVYPGARIEGVGPLDMLCLDAELGLVIALTAMLPSPLRGRLCTGMLALGLTALVARATGLLA